MKNIKKVLAVVLVLAMVLSLAACGNSASNNTPAETNTANQETNTTPVEKEPETVAEKIEAAQKMTEDELKEAALKELADNPSLTFNADSLTSGIKKALPKFAAKYGIDESRVAYNSKKGSEYQPKLIAAADANTYIADFVMIQDASFLKESMRVEGDEFLLSYTPTGEGFNIAEEDTNPQVGVTFNKVFMWYNTVKGADRLKNVWQLTGKDGASLPGLVKQASYQSPLGEDVNMNFLIMMTSPAACEKLTAAYKSYFGKDYDANADENAAYTNIGYKFVAEFIKNVGFWHSSDSSEVKKINEYEADGRIIFAGLCKLKDYEYYKDEYKDADNYYTKTISAAGWNTQVEGFDGFVYNMWILIPRTAQLPYTSCLFVRYLLTEEGFNAGWGGILGYYSANQKISSVDGDPALATWKKQCLVEDVNYIDSAYVNAVKFINQQMK